MLDDPDTVHLAQCALAAEFFGMPLFAYVDHLRRTRERYGERVAQLDLDYALALREQRIAKQNEAGERLSNA